MKVRKDTSYVCNFGEKCRKGNGVPIIINCPIYAQSTEIIEKYNLRHVSEDCGLNPPFVYSEMKGKDYTETRRMIEGPDGRVLFMHDLVEKVKGTDGKIFCEHVCYPSGPKPLDAFNEIKKILEQAIAHS